VKDENDKAVAGELPEDPEEGTRVIDDGPRLVNVHDILSASLTRAMKPRQKRGGTTGSRALDGITGGLRSGFTWVMAAETSFGKSSWAVAVADQNLRSGGRVLIISTEDQPSIYGDRLLARRAKINAKRLRDGCITAEEQASAVATVLRAERDPVYLDAIGKPVEWVLKHLPAMVREYEIDIVIVDYLQEMRSTQKHQDRRLELSFIAGSLRASIKGLGACGILLSQITKKQDGSPPNKYSARDSQDIVNGAEVVVVGYELTTSFTDAGGREWAAGTKVLKVDKNKNGPKGTVPMTWDSEIAAFYDEPDPTYDAIDNLHDDFNDVFKDDFDNAR
jgi:replicative DNA helicase